MLTNKKLFLQQKIRKDYEDHFITESTVALRLTFDEIMEFLNDSDMQNMLHNAINLRFYAKQLLLVSFTDAEQKKPKAEQAAWRQQAIKELLAIVDEAQHCHTRAFVTFIQLAVDMNNISTAELKSIFDGTRICDSYCAQVAFSIWKARTLN